MLGALRDAVFVNDAKGRVVYGNRAAEQLTGYSGEDLVGRTATNLVPERWRELLTTAYADALQSPALTTLNGSVPMRFPLLRRDGTEVEVEATVSVVAGKGRTPLVITSLRDARSRQASERQAALFERLLGVVAGAPTPAEAGPALLDAIARVLRADAACLWLIDPEGAILHCQAFWCHPDHEMWEFERRSRGETRSLGEGLAGIVLASGKPLQIDDLHTEPGFKRADAALAAGLRVGFALPLRAPGRVLGVMELFFQDEPTTLSDIDAIVDLGEEVATFLDRRLADEHMAELLAREQEAREEAESSHQRLEFLLAAGAHISSSLDEAEVLERLARLAVPMLGDLCIVDLVDEEDNVTIHRVLVAHSDPEIEAAIGSVLVGVSIDGRSQHPIARVLRNAEPELWEDLTPERLRASLGDEELVQAAIDLDLGSQVTVPLRSRGQNLGALSLITMGGRGRYDRTDLALAVELGRQAGLAMDNGRQYQRERNVVESLQRAFLPEHLPHIEGYELAARYLGGPAGEIGGDWYDAFLMSDGRIGLVIGDVGGHGLPAAATMGQLRNALRALALTGDDPADVSNRLDRHFHELEPGSFATLCFGILNPETGELSYSSAGHVPALLVEIDGTSAFLPGTYGAPLGTHPFAAGGSAQFTLAPGATLLFYTDGLVEDRTQSIDDGLNALQSAAVDRVLAGLDLEDLADGVIIERLAGVRRRDDVAVLALRRTA